MQRFFLFTLILLFATAGLLVAHLHADKPFDVDSGTVLDNVFVEAYASTSWSAPYASSHMDGFVMNNGGHRTKVYADFTTNIEGPLWNRPDKHKGGGGWVEIDERWSDNYNVSFNMSNRRAGSWMIWASTDITVKADLNGDGDVSDANENASKRAYACTRFSLR